jgi:signal transduction histidine kinase
LLVKRPESITGELLGLTLLVAAVEALPVPAWGDLQISVGVPLLLMMAILFPPAAAGLAAVLSATDLREIRREIPVLVALFNRAQVALSVIAASWVFHLVAEVGSSAAWLLVLAAVLASAADYAINVGVVTSYMSIKTGAPPFRVARELRIGRIGEFLVSYLGLAVLGLTLAVLFTHVSWWALPAFLAPMLFARQMFIRSQALEEAHKELQEREQVLKTLSNAMAEERADERLQIAGYLHDDLAQVLFRLSIQVDVARKLMEKEDYSQVNTQLEKIRESKQETSERIRALIRDLHRSPLGAKGLAEALESFTDEQGRDSGVVFHRDVADIALPAPIALLVYHIAREAVMNSLKHAQATDMWIAVRETGDNIELELRDNGVGFDTNAPGPEGHFGMAMMRERAKVGGGTIELQSAPGEGATITVRFPISLLQQEQQVAADDPKSSGGGDGSSGDASPGTSGRSGKAAGDSRQTVRA